jgi:YebC/PmpR family DNA-binding regulatory protein
MAGHSKWANIKHRKGAQDIKKGKVFGQLSRLIRSTVREGGTGDPNFNPNLRLALDKARQANMPKENVERAIDRGLGKGASGNMNDVVYEGYGPNGVAILATAITDNPNRTGTEVRTAFSRHGGNLAGPGSAMFMFSRGTEGDYTCTMPMTIEDEAMQEQVQELIDALLELDDVEEVFCSAVWEGQE